VSCFAPFYPHLALSGQRKAPPDPARPKIRAITAFIISIALNINNKLPTP